MAFPGMVGMPGGGGANSGATAYEQWMTKTVRSLHTIYHSSPTEQCRYKVGWNLASSNLSWLAERASCSAVRSVPSWRVYVALGMSVAKRS